VSGAKKHTKQKDMEHLRLEFDTANMSDSERKSAADALRRALAVLEKRGRDYP
jgi:hypothetical protein